jgi:hypothetical protein
MTRTHCLGPDGVGCFIPHDCDGRCSWRAQQVYTCAECGHLHFLGRELGYERCPVDGCNCEGQEWAKDLLRLRDLQAGERLARR